MKHFIYVIQNKINNKIYIGQSINPKKRFSSHKTSARACGIGKPYKNAQYIHRAMAKHGTDNFEFQIIEEWDSKEECDEAEIFWIEFFQTRNNNFGYNEVKGGAALGSGPDHPSYGKPAHNKLFSEEQEQEIISLYKTGQHTIMDLGEKYNCSFTVINNLLKRHKIETLGNAHFSKGKHYSPETQFQPGQEAHNKIFDAEQEKEICTLYTKQELSTTQIAERFGCHRTVIIRLLNDNNIAMRDRGFYSKGKAPPNKLFSEEQEKQICEEYQNTVTNITIMAEKWKCDRSVISDTLKKHNISIHKKRIKRGKFSFEQRVQMMQDYEELGSYRKVGKKHRVCPKTVKSICTNPIYQKELNQN